MAIAISEIDLQKIYGLSNEDKIDLMDLILNSMRSIKNVAKTKKKESWVSQFAGKWQDNKSAEEMIADIRSARTTNRDFAL